MIQKSGNKNFDDNIKLWQDQGWQNRGMTVSYIKPHLEFAAPVWNPYAKVDIEKLEKIQHRAI